MLPSLASIDDLADRFSGRVSDDDLARAQAALDDASSIIRSVAGTDWTVTDDDVVSLDVVPDIVVTVCCRAALRAFTNPAGVTQETTGPFSTSFANGSTNVYLMDDERAMVMRAAGITGGAFSIDTVPSCSTVHAEVCALNFGANHCSCGAILAGYPLYEADVT